MSCPLLYFEILQICLFIMREKLSYVTTRTTNGILLIFHFETPDDDVNAWERTEILTQASERNSDSYIPCAGKFPIHNNSKSKYY